MFSRALVKSQRAVDAGVIIHILVYDAIIIGNCRGEMVMCLCDDSTYVIEHALLRSLMHGIAESSYHSRIILIADIYQALECLGAVVDAD